MKTTDALVFAVRDDDSNKERNYCQYYEREYKCYKKKARLLLTKRFQFWT
jgi:hypothetical protein